MFADLLPLDLSAAHSGACRVELWSGSTQLTRAAPILNGGVTEKRVTGIRRTLRLSVDPSTEWAEWLTKPRLEVVPYAGYNYGNSIGEVPMGVFPLDPPGRSLPTKDISITADDRWSRVQNAGFLYAIQSYPGFIRDVIARLIDEVQIGVPTVVTASNSVTQVPPLVWDRSRHDTIVSLLEPIGGEAFFDRYGTPVVRDLTSVPGRPLTDATVVTINTSPNWDAVKNEVAVSSSKQGVSFFPAISYIADPNHPAHLWKMGRRSMSYSSPLIDTYAQAQIAAEALLEKHSAPALSWSVSCVPDYSRDAGDRITVSTDLGIVQAVIQEITHPLGPGEQTMVLGAAL